jgi:protein SCO1/2
MFYASCAVACPLLVSEVDQVLAELPESARRDVEVLLVSFDAARDTPAKLSALAQDRRLDDSRWTLAAASDGDARALAAMLGIKYRRLANGDFAHGSTIVALDGEGHPIARTDALGQRAALLAALTASRDE